MVLGTHGTTTPMAVHMAVHSTVHIMVHMAVMGDPMSSCRSKEQRTQYYTYQCPLRRKSCTTEGTLFYPRCILRIAILMIQREDCDPNTTSPLRHHDDVAMANIQTRTKYFSKDLIVPTKPQLLNPGQEDRISYLHLRHNNRSDHEPA